MSSLDILNALWLIIATDTELLLYLNLTPQSTVNQKAAKIQKEREPDGLAKNNIPLICMYPMDGLPNRLNSMVYDAEVQVDIYTASLYQCMLIGKRLQSPKVWNGIVPPVQSGASFEMEFMGEFAGESDVVGIKKYSQRWALGDVLWR